VDLRRLLGLYPRAWRERYADELIAMIDGRTLSRREAFDLVAGALRERAIQMRAFHVVVPMVLAATLNAIGWRLRDLYGTEGLSEFATFGVIVLWMGAWGYLLVRSLPRVFEYVRWAFARTRRDWQRAAWLSPLEAQACIMASAPAAVLAAWTWNLPAEWWAVMANPFFSMSVLLLEQAWPPPVAPMSMSAVQRNPPPANPLGLA
jgi:hypothetical protein